MKTVICPPPFRPTGVRADLSFSLFPRRRFHDMFSRPAPVEFEEIEIAGALFG